MHRTRHRRRYHRDRIVDKRIAQSRRLRWWPDSLPESPGGRHASEQWDLGCHGARCGVCHAETPRERRSREKRAWRQLENIAWEGAMPRRARL